MADQTRVVKILIDDAQLQKALDGARKRAETLENKMAKMDTGSKRWAELDTQLQKVNKDIATFEGQLSGKLEPSTKQLKAEFHRLNAILENMPKNLRASSAEFKRFNAIGAELSRIKAEARQTDKAMSGIKQRLNGIADGFNKYIGLITGFFAAFTGVILGFRKAKETFDEFESAIANLSALTKLQGEQLEYLKKKAIEFSVATFEGNVKITKSANEIADAFTIVGSKRPELLKSKEALAEVTRQALILAEADPKLTLDDAVQGLTNTLNQFNLPASESSNIINAMAAGSQAGAGAIPYLSEAVEKSGTAAKFANLHYTETIGLIETLAPRFASAEMAGTQLKNVLLKLEAGPKKFRPSVVGLNQALANLSTENLTVAESQKMFGQENINAASILIQYRGEVEQYTKAVQGTNTALEQAAINTDTNRAKMAQAKNELSNTLMELGEKLSPIVTKATGLVNKLMVVLINLPKFWKENQNLIIAITGAYLALNSAKIVWLATTLREHLLLRTGIGLKLKDNIIAALTLIRTEAVTAAQAKQNIASKLLAGSLAGLRAAYTLLLGPIGLAIAAITGLVLVLKNWESITGSNNELEKKSSSLKKDLSEANKGLKETIDALNKSGSNYNAMSRAEMEETRKLIKSKIDETKARLENYKARQLEVGEKASKPTAWQQVANIALYGNSAPFSNIADGVQNGIEAMEQFDDRIGSITESLTILEDKYGQVSTILGAEQLGDAITGNSNNEIQDKINQYSTALNQLQKGSEDYIRVLDKLEKARKQMDKNNPDAVNPEEKKAEAFFEKVVKIAEDSRLLLEKKDEQTEERIKLKYKRLEEEALKYYSKNHRTFVLLEEAMQNELQKVRNDAWDKELAELDKEFKEGLKKIEKNYDDVKKLRQELSDAVAKNSLDEVAAHHSSLQKIVSDEDRSLNERRTAQKQLFDAEIKELQTKQALERGALEEKLKNVELSDGQREEIAQQILSLEANTANQKLLIEQNYQEAVEQMERAALTRKIEAVSNYVSQLQGIYGSISQIQSNNEQARINQIQENHQQELDQLEAQKEKKVVNDKDYAAKKKEIDARYRAEEAAIKTRQFQRQKVADSIQAIINTAVAVAKTFAQFGFPAGILPAALAAAAGAAQVGVIASQPTPKFGTGADLRNKGKKHTQGGILAELETGEVVLSAATVANNADLVDKLLDSSLNKGGAALNVPTQPVLDFTPFFTASKILFATGGKVGDSTQPTTTVQTNNNTSYAIPNELMQLMGTLTTTVNKLDNTLNKGIPAYFNSSTVRDISEEQTKQTESDNIADF